MSAKLYSVIALIAISGSVYSGYEDDDQIVRISRSVCGPNALQKNVNLFRECHQKEPEYMRSADEDCVKQILNLTQISEPYFCYLMRPEREQVL